jgi:HEPN domain-containing protein
MNRAHDWLAQAERDLAAAEGSKKDGSYEWACFQAQQAAEKAAKGLLQKYGVVRTGHSIVKILERVNEFLEISNKLTEAGQRLERYYTLPRYPNGFAEGAPFEHFNEAMAEEALDDAKAVIEFARENVS